MRLLWHEPRVPCPKKSLVTQSATNCAFSWLQQALLRIYKLQFCFLAFFILNHYSHPNQLQARNDRLRLRIRSVELFSRLMEAPSLASYRDIIVSAVADALAGTHDRLLEDIEVYIFSTGNSSIHFFSSGQM